MIGERPYVFIAAGFALPIFLAKNSCLRFSTESISVVGLSFPDPLDVRSSEIHGSTSQHDISVT